MFDFFKNMKLGTRIISLVLLQIIMLIIVGIYALVQIHHLELEIDELSQENIPLIEDVGKILQKQLDQALRFGEILQYAHSNKKNKFEKGIENFLDAGKNMQEILKDGVSRSKAGVKLAKEHNKDEEEKEFKKILHLFQDIKLKHDSYERHCEELFVFLEDDMNKKMMFTPGAEEGHSKSTETGHENLGNEAENKVVKKITSINEAMEAIEHEVKVLEEELNEITEHIQVITRGLTEEAKEVQANAFRTLIILTLLSTIAGGGFSIFVSIITARTVRNAVNSISNGAEEVTAASNDIAQTSQDLADNATKQAASIEETSASLEGLASSSASNAENTKEANSLIHRSDSIVQSTTSYIDNLNHSSENMLSFSDKIAIIVRTFNDYANQLNILSTNATAEATRSEATKGFAVFTIEIKKLVGQLVEKAQEAGNLVDVTLRDIKKGFEISDSTRKDFAEISQISTKLKAIVENVNNASMEQDQSISEINIAVATISDVTQASAATSEEAAAASEELNAQADTMLQVVDELVALVGKKKN